MKSLNTTSLAVIRALCFLSNCSSLLENGSIQRKGAVEGPAWDKVPGEGRNGTVAKRSGHTEGGQRGKREKGGRGGREERASKGGLTVGERAERISEGQKASGAIE